jgi:hypothetical protein
MRRRRRGRGGGQPEFQMLIIFETTAVIVAIGIPFFVIMWMMCRTTRNRGEMYGGGWEKYDALRNGWVDSIIRRGGRRRKP